MNIALPSAQRALHFTTVERQWVVTAYTLAFGSLLLPGGKLADLFGRKVAFLTGLAGFAGVSAIGGASVNFAMLITARACQGAFAALLVPSALSLLTTTFTEQKDRGRAFGIYGAIAAAGLFGIFLFLTYYLQQTLGYSPLVTGVAFLPISGGLVVASSLSTIVLMPRTGPRPLVALGMLAAAGGAAWLAQLGPHTGYAAGVLGPIILAGIGVGMVIAPVINTGTFGVAPQDAGVASATVTVGQQLGASVGTSLLNTIFTAAVTSYLAAHLAAARLIGRPALTGLALAHGYDTAFWWIAGGRASVMRTNPVRRRNLSAAAPGGCGELQQQCAGRLRVFHHRRVSHARQQLDAGAGHDAVGGSRRGGIPRVLGAEDH